MGSDTQANPDPLSPAPQAVRTRRQWEAYAEESLRRGSSPGAAVQDMVGQGLPQAEAGSIVQAAIDKQTQLSNRIIGCSGAMVAAGLLVTVGTYSASSSMGGAYLIWWGPVVCGVIGLVVGICRRPRPG